jgi:K+-sensing histidine kinase KdpD
MSPFHTLRQSHHPAAPAPRAKRARFGSWVDWAWSLTCCVLSTVACQLMLGRFAIAELVMIVLLGVVVVALRTSLYPSIFAALLSTLTFDFFFIPPYGDFRPIDPRHFVTLAVMLLVAVVISGLAERARRHAEETETERLRNALLSSISHDLRTPLTAITGAATTMLEENANLDETTRRDLAETIYEESDHLNRLLSNLLYMTRLEAGEVVIRKEWQPLEEVIGTAISRLEPQIHDRHLVTHFPDAVPSAPFDAVLIEQVMVNLIENALRHAPPQSSVDISASGTDSHTIVEVADRGSGVAEKERQRIFEKFYRGNPRKADGGMGLGLTICRAIVLAHGGQLWVEDRHGGGAVFRFLLPHDRHTKHSEGRLPEVRGASMDAS